MSKKQMGCIETMNHILAEKKTQVEIYCTKETPSVNPQADKLLGVTLFDSRNLNEKSIIRDICTRAKALRPSEYFESSYTLFNKISPYVVFQNYLADCYFICCLAVMAMYPSRIQALFKEHSIKESGVYTIFAYICGKKTEIEVNDFLIYDPYLNCLPFSSSTSEDIWVQLLEKAWAKVNGSFSAIEFGNEAEAFEFLVGAPTKYYFYPKLKLSIDELWIRLRQYRKKHYMLGLCTKDFFPSYLKNEGMVQNHSYSVLDVLELKDGARVLLLLDPWKSTSYEGKYSKNPPGKWEQVLEVIDYDASEAFAISYEQHFGYFEHITICFYEEDYSHSCTEINGSGIKEHLFDIETTTECTLSLHQPTICPRQSKEKSKNYTPIFVILGRKNDLGFEYITSFVALDYTKKKSITLTPGHYCLYTGADWSPISSNYYTIHFYSKNPINLIDKSKYSMEDLISIVSNYVLYSTTWEDVGPSLQYFAEMSHKLGFGVSAAKYTGSSKLLFQEKMELKGLKRVYPSDSAIHTFELSPSKNLMVSIYQFTEISSFSFRYQYSFL